MSSNERAEVFGKLISETLQGRFVVDPVIPLGESGMQVLVHAPSDYNRDDASEHLNRAGIPHRRVPQGILLDVPEEPQS